MNNECMDAVVAYCQKARNGVPIGIVCQALQAQAERDALRAENAKLRERVDKLHESEEENCNLTIIVGRLCHALSKRDPGNTIVEQARDYVKRIGKEGSPLRQSEAQIKGIDYIGLQVWCHVGMEECEALGDQENAAIHRDLYRVVSKAYDAATAASKEGT